jgi:hypothetical protein
MPKPGVFSVTPEEVAIFDRNGKWEDVRNLVEEMDRAPVGTWLKIEGGSDIEKKRKRLGSYANRVNLYYITRIHNGYLYVRKMQGPKFKEGKRI